MRTAHWAPLFAGLPLIHRLPAIDPSGYAGLDVYVTLTPLVTPAVKPSEVIGVPWLFAKVIEPPFELVITRAPPVVCEARIPVIAAVLMALITADSVVPPVVTIEPLMLIASSASTVGLVCVPVTTVGCPFSQLLLPTFSHVAAEPVIKVVDTVCEALTVQVEPEPLVIVVPAVTPLPESV